MESKSKLEFDINSEGLPTFFAVGQVSDEAVEQCIEAHNVLTGKPGTTGDGLNPGKVSEDVCLTAAYLNISKELELMKIEYGQYFNLQSVINSQLTEHINIQKYPKEVGGFHAWHYENDGERNVPNTEMKFRMLVWMTYLNDVKDGGETQFYFYNKQFKPKKGLTVLWPAYYTHIHRGVPSKTCEKIIATGWFNHELYDPKGYHENIFGS